MKAINRWVCCFCFLTLSLSCKDISESVPVSNPEPAAPFPLERTVHDVQGRPLEATFLAKSGAKVLLRRKSDGQEFVLGLDKLSELDRTFLSELPDYKADRVQGVEKSAAKAARLAGRQATWHNDLENAKREALRYKLPICLVFLRSNDAKISEPFDRGVLRTTEFREWANKNAVLCLNYTEAKDNATGSSLSGATTRDGQNLAASYKVGKKTPVVLVLNADGTVRGKPIKYNREGPSAYIAKLNPLLPKD